jgi:hypothetical protein
MCQTVLANNLNGKFYNSIINLALSVDEDYFKRNAGMFATCLI